MKNETAFFVWPGFTIEESLFVLWLLAFLETDCKEPRECFRLFLRLIEVKVLKSCWILCVKCLRKLKDLKMIFSWSLKKLTKILI